MNPRVEAIAFRIWQHAEPLGWNCTHTEVAEAIGESFGAVRNICKVKGWNTRFRVTTYNGIDRVLIGGVWGAEMQEAQRIREEVIEDE